MSTSEEKSLDVVQRAIFATLTGIATAPIVLGLCAYVLYDTTAPADTRIGLWVMAGVVGVAIAAAVRLILGKRWLSPWLVLGLIPMGIVGWLMFR